MKILQYFVAIMFVTVAFGQNFAVTYWGPNGQSVPVGWPRIVSPIGTNTVAPGADAVLTQSQIDAVRAGLQDEYDALQDAKEAAAKAILDANLARLHELYTQIPAARSNYSFGLTLLATIDASLASGTNTQAQVVARMRQMVAVQQKTVQYVDGITEILQRFGPVLKQLYRPEEE